MFLLKVLLVLLLIRAGRCFKYSCESKKHDGECYRQLNPGDQSNYSSNFSFSSKNAVSWTLLEGSAGYLNVSFILPKGRKHTCYQIDLYVDESLSEEECRNSPNKLRMTEDTFHSRRAYSIHECTSDCSCPKRGTVTFQYVFTGCYRVEFFPFHENGTQRKENSSATYLHSAYSKSLLATGNITVTAQPRPLLHTCDIKFSVDDHITLSNLKFELNRIPWTMCEFYNEPPQLCQTCKIEHGTVECTFHNMTDGHYCLTVSIIDDRCEPHTLWTRKHPCNFKANFTYSEEAYKPHIGFEPEVPIKPYVIFGVVVAVVCLAIVGCIITLRYFILRAHQETPSTKFPNNAIPLEPCRVFLLYARDCQPFMELMTTLREVLEDATKSEVIDCLDASRWNEIARNPVEWVRRHIEHPNTKVVLVATQCAYLRQQAHLKQVVTCYKERETYDNLFTYGLKTLTENLSQDIYRKISVVRFEGFSDDANLFSHLTPYTRFVLPLHLHKLIYNLQPSGLPDENTQLEESKEIQKLYQDLTTLINFKNKNMNYLEDMLTIQRQDVS